MSRVPAELVALRERAAILNDLDRIGALMFWDQNTMMPPRGAVARGDQAATLQTVHHERLTDPELGRLLDVLEPWAAGEDPDSDDVRLIAELRRDVGEGGARADAAGRGDEPRGRARAGGVGAGARRRRLRPLPRRDGPPPRAPPRVRRLLHGPRAPVRRAPGRLRAGDDRPARLRPLFAELREALVPLVAATAGPLVLPFGGEVDVESQRRACMLVLEGVGFDPDGWRLDVAPHPFAQAHGSGDVRVTTRYDLHDFAGAYFGALHEFGHGLYEAQIPRAPRAQPARQPRLARRPRVPEPPVENLVGRSLAFCTSVAPRLAGSCPATTTSGPEELYRRVDTVHRNLIRVEADETT